MRKALWLWAMTSLVVFLMTAGATSADSQRVVIYVSSENTEYATDLWPDPCSHVPYDDPRFLRYIEETMERRYPEVGLTYSFVPKGAQSDGTADTAFDIVIGSLSSISKTVEKDGRSIYDASRFVPVSELRESTRDIISKIQPSLIDLYIEPSGGRLVPFLFGVQHQIGFDEDTFKSAGVETPSDIADIGEWNWEKYASLALRIAEIDSDNDGQSDYGTPLIPLPPLEILAAQLQGRTVDYRNGVVDPDGVLLDTLHIYQNLLTTYYSLHQRLIESEPQKSTFLYRVLPNTETTLRSLASGRPVNSVGIPSVTPLYQPTAVVDAVCVLVSSSCENLDFAADFVEFLLSDELARTFRNMTDMSSIPTAVTAYPANTSVTFMTSQPSDQSDLVDGIELTSALEGLVVPWVSVDKLAYSNHSFDAKFARVIRSVGSDHSAEDAYQALVDLGSELAAE